MEPSIPIEYLAKQAALSPSAPMPSSEPELPKVKAIRISRVPKAVSYDKLEKWLEELALSNTPIASGNLIHLSIARITPEFSQATATFKTLPVSFRNVDKGTQIVYGPEKSRIAIDTHFNDITVLYDPSQVGEGHVAAECVDL
jgi:hypothetical protein